MPKWLNGKQGYAYMVGELSFHGYYFGLSVERRAAYAKTVGTTVNYLERVAGGFRLPSLKMAHRLVRESKGDTSYAAIVQAFEAKHGPL